MLTIDEIETHLSTIYSQRRALNRAAAALNIARAVAHLREQFPTAAYAWVDIDTGTPFAEAVTADILRVHSATGEVLWDAKGEDPEEIESPATDALVYAVQASEHSVSYPRSTHPVAGLAPATDSGTDPGLLMFNEADKAAQTAAWSTEVTTAVVPQLNNGQPTLVLFPVPLADTIGRELDFDQANAVKLGAPTVVGPNEFPTTSGETYTRNQVADAISEACDDITTHGDLGASDAESAMNVLLNVAMTYLDDPDADIHTAVERCYDGEYPRILRDIADQAPERADG